MERALETGSLAVLTLAFLAVGREGVETALFMVGYAEAQTAWPLIGLVIGVLAAAAIAYGMYAGAVRINLAKFFKYTGVFLIVVAAGILSYGIGALQTVGWLPGLSAQGVRHQYVVQLVVLVRRDHSGHLQRHAHADRAAARGVAGLPRHRADDLPAPDEGACETRSFPTTSTRTRKVDHVNLHSSLAIATAALAGLALTSCQAKEEAKPAEPGKSAPAEIAVTASDTACELSGTEATTGPSTFVITNNGTKVTEFYVYGEGERVMGEVENISPGLQRKLIVQLGEPGTYQTACKPGMVGDGIRGDFKVTGDVRQDRRRGQVQRGLRQLQALREQPDRRTDRGHSGLRRRRQEG